MRKNYLNNTNNNIHLENNFEKKKKKVGNAFIKSIDSIWMQVWALLYCYFSSRFQAHLLD